MYNFTLVDMALAIVILFIGLGIPMLMYLEQSFTKNGWFTCLALEHKLMCVGGYVASLILIPMHFCHGVL